MPGGARRTTCRRPNLSPRQSAAAKAAQARARETAPARPLGTTPGLNFIYAHPQPRHHRARSELHLPRRTRPRRTGLVANAYLEGTYSEYYHEITPDEPACENCSSNSAFPAASRATSRPRPPARIHEGGELARLCAVACVRRGVRQSRFDRRGRRGRRRGRDRPARDRLARQQIPQPRARRRRAADPAPQRLQDRQPVLPRAHPARRTQEVPRRLRLRAALRRGPRARKDAPGDGRHARHHHREDPPHPARRAHARLQAPPRLADDRAAFAQGLDLPEVHRREKMRGLLARPPGADGRNGPARSREDPRDVDEELPAEGIVRRVRPARARTRGARPRRATGA